MNRTARKEAIFKEDRDCVLFLDTLSSIPHRFGAKVHGYALMPNHFHLMLEAPRGNLSEVMKFVGASFTQAYNRAHDHDGPLFRGRFRNALVEDDAYWMHLLAYLHLNPVASGLARQPKDCVWTSHLAYVGAIARPDWLTTSDLLAKFGSAEAVATYVDDVGKKRRQAPANFDPERLWRAPTSAPEPTPAWSPRTPEQAIADVATVLCIREDTVLVRRRGRTPNLSAWLAVWWLHRGADLSLTEIARRLGVSRPRVGAMRDKLFEHAKKNPDARRAIESLRDVLP